MLILLVDQSCDNENWQFLAKNQFFGRCGFFFLTHKLLKVTKHVLVRPMRGFGGWESDPFHWPQLRSRYLRSWDIGAKPAKFRPYRRTKIIQKWPGISLVSQLLGRNSKIASMILKASSRWASKKNLSQFGPAVWAVGGGASDLGRSSSCNSGTSVIQF